MKQLFVFLISFFFISAASAQTNKSKPNEQHDKAMKHCKDVYDIAMKNAKMLRGKRREKAISKAKHDYINCVAAAPR